MNLENKKQLATILLAVGLGLVAAFLMSQYVKNEIQEQTKALARDYEKKNSALIKEIEFVKKDLKALATRQAAMAQQQQNYASDLKKQFIAGGTGSGSGDINASAESAALSVRTPQGKRAVTVMIDSLSAVGGLVNPGDFVDVIAELEIKKGQATKKGLSTDTLTSVIFQNLQVLAINTNFENIGNATIYEQQQKARSLFITFAVTPEESALLTFAQSNGKLKLALRGPKERGTQLLQVASWEELADFVLEKQGTELMLPTKGLNPVSEDVDEAKPFIQIFKSGQESSF